ncbi:MAG TPA: sugar ABC transporter permease [Symbiobacteriaceae bacterium]|nr:sugar ABC transporter permease [Symbiobacteriaceae bacterium]
MKRQTSQERMVFWGFVTPTLFAFVMVLVVPFALGVFYSFTNWTGIRGNPVNFTGLTNFVAIFQDARFFYSFGLTALYAVVSMTVVNIAAFGLALLVTQELKLRNIYRTGFFLPNLIGGLVLGYIWQFVFNAAIPKLGDALHWEFLRKSLLTDPKTAFFAIVFVAAWQYAGYIMMIYIAALQNVPSELTEAAAIDGANGWQRLRHITFPMIAPAFTVSSFLTLVNAFKMFDVNVSLTNGMPTTQFMGKSVFGTELVAMNIYNTAFGLNRMAQGQAKAVVFFVVLVVVSLIQVYFNKKREVEM